MNESILESANDADKKTLATSCCRECEAAVWQKDNLNRLSCFCRVTGRQSFGKEALSHVVMCSVLLSANSVDVDIK